MALLNPVTKHKSYVKYLHTIGVMPTEKLERCFSCGLPAVWLYMKAIGLEDVYFDLLDRIKDRSTLFKELFYLLILTNGHNKFFPHIAEDFLNLEIPPDVAAAQIKIKKPIFEMAYMFSRDQIIETLQAITKPNAMIRVGNQRKAVGIMFSDDTYHVYHSDNPRPLEFKNIDKCADLIMRVLK